MDDPTLPNDLRAAADNPSGIFPAWMSDHFRAEADRIDASREKWARLVEAPPSKRRKGTSITEMRIVNTETEAEEYEDE